MIKKAISLIVAMVLFSSLAFAIPFGQGTYGLGLYGGVGSEPTAAPAGGGGGGGGAGGNTQTLNQLQCNINAKNLKRCLTYSSASKSCETGCADGFSCNENFVCEGAFLQPDYVAIQNIVLPQFTTQKQCLDEGFTYFDNACFACNGKLANLKGTVVCINCPSGFTLNDQDQCVSSDLILRTQSVLNPLDRLARKINPDNPVMGFAIIIVVVGAAFYVSSNWSILRRKIKK
jgi:hypothetical protein|tara:strand:+ start:11489 stop:12181 length:693 start_codon:yes stop_codon:yes gene_type:complete